MIERVLNDSTSTRSQTPVSASASTGFGDKSYNLIAGTHLLNIQQNGPGPYGSTAMKTSLTPSGGRISIWMRTTAAAKPQLPNAIPICRTPLHTAADCVFCGRTCGRLFYALSSPSRTISRGLPSVSKICVPFSGKPVIIRVNRYTIAFPRQSAWRRARPRILRRCASATAPKYICAAARQVASGAVNLETVRHMDYAHAKAELLRLTGVGIKVAECICLFALHHIDAFPIDTHIRQMWTHTIRKGFR